MAAARRHRHLARQLRAPRGEVGGRAAGGGGEAGEVGRRARAAGGRLDPRSGTFRWADRGGSWGPRGPRRTYHPPSRARCVQQRRVASFECANCMRSRPNSVLDEMWARTVVSISPRSFVGLVPSRCGAARPTGRAAGLSQRLPRHLPMRELSQSQPQPAEYCCYQSGFRAKPPHHR